MFSGLDDDGWQEMPIVRESRTPSDSSSDEAGPSSSSMSRRAGTSSNIAKRLSKRRAKHASADVTSPRSGYGSVLPTTNATGRSLDVDDARGYDWRAKPRNLEGGKASSSSNTASDNDDDSAARKQARREARNNRRKRLGKDAGSASSDSDDDDDDDASGDGARGYTQLRLDEDVEGDELQAATDYLFGGGSDTRGGPPTSTPLAQLATTKQLLSEGQKIAYVGLVSLVAKNFVRELQRVPGKDLEHAIASAIEWRLRVTARLYQHMDIEASEQKMIDSLAEHGVLPEDLAPSLITTSTIDNPDFDPEAERERNEERAERAREEEHRKAEEEYQKEEAQRQAAKEAEAEAAARKLAQRAVKQADDAQDLPRRDSLGLDLGEGSGSSRVEPEVKPAAAAPAPPRQSEDEDGDIGAYESDEDEAAPPPPYAKVETAEASEASGDISAAIDDEGDIAAGATTPVVASPKTPKAEITEPAPLGDKTPLSRGISIVDEAQQVAQAKSADEKEIPGPLGGEEALSRPDPNTAAQVGQLADVGDAKVTPLGLTSAPQTIDTMPSALDGVTTELSSADRTITLDLRWTVLCDLFLVLTADSVYDARSRVLLEAVAVKLGLTWMDVTKFEKRVTDALEIEEGVAGSLKSKRAVKRRAEAARRRRMVMMGLATVGGGLVIGLSAGLLAPVIGAGLGAALGTIGIGGTTGFLGGVGGATIITTTATAGGMAIGGNSMNRRTRNVRTFEFKPLHNNKRVNLIVTMPGFMNGAQDDPRLPFSVLDSIMGDVFSVLWEPDMMQEMGNAINLLYNETLAMGVQQLLAATIAGGLVGALAWPLWLTKLGYLIDNPWSNALDRAHSAGLILADVLSKRQLGVRPVTLVGFSLGARSIFYALVELARQKKFGIVQNVYLLGAPVTASDKMWKEARSTVAGRFVNAFSRTDWILGYLFRATTGGMRSIAGLHPVERVPELENVDVTRTVPGHLYYRAFMPLVLDELGFRCTADYFDEPEDLEKIPEREVVEQQLEERNRQLRSVQTKTGGFGKIFKRRGSAAQGASSSSSAGGTPSSSKPATPLPGSAPGEYDEDDADDLPPRVDEDEESHQRQPQSAPIGGSGMVSPLRSAPISAPATRMDEGRVATPEQARPATDAVHFDTQQILAELRESGVEVKEIKSSLPPLPLTPTGSRDGSPVPPTTSRMSASAASLAAQPPASVAEQQQQQKEKEERAKTLPRQLKMRGGGGSMWDTLASPSRRSSEATSASASVGAGSSDGPAGGEASSSSGGGGAASRRPYLSYAPSFSSAAFDLPPPPPPPMLTADSGGVQLSFADAYDDDDGEQDVGGAGAGKGSEGYGATAGKGYGLSPEAAEQLKRQFSSTSANAATANGGRADDDGWGSTYGATSTDDPSSAFGALSLAPGTSEQENVDPLVRPSHGREASTGTAAKEGDKDMPTSAAPTSLGAGGGGGGANEWGNPWG